MSFEDMLYYGLDKYLTDEDELRLWESIYHHEKADSSFGDKYDPIYFGKLTEMEGKEKILERFYVTEIWEHRLDEEGESVWETKKYTKRINTLPRMIEPRTSLLAVSPTTKGQKTAFSLLLNNYDQITYINLDRWQYTHRDVWVKADCLYVKKFEVKK